MAPRILTRIREAVAAGDYDVTRHAVEEMAEDGLLISDVEHVLVTGVLSRRAADDPRGPRYTISGRSEDGRHVGVVGRFTDTGIFLVITVYESTAPADG